jgi:DNA-binding transcriptional regulator LsrR (DeoR family)
MLEDMLDKWRRGARGPLPQLTPLQLLNALVLINDQGPVGRRALAQALQINDGVTRGLLERLAEQGLVEVSEGTGVKLSKQGQETLKKYLRQIAVRKIKTLDEIELVPGRVSVGVHLAKMYKPGITGVSQRDEAIKAGAEGTLTTAVVNGKLVIPPDNKKVAELSSREDARLRELFRLSENDLVVIGFGKDANRALSGALAAVLSLEKH